MSSIAPKDLTRLRYALQRKDVDLRQSLFGPDSMTWKVNREGLLLLGGGRALLLQVAHPLVAAGVAKYSNYKGEPLQRLQRTLDLTLSVTFSDASGAIAAIREIERRHARVRGELSASTGPFAAGTKYHANDPALLFWVHATLVDTSLIMYERFFQPLAAEERERFYEESKITARIFGIPEKYIPATLADFDSYMMTKFEGEELAVSDESRDIASAILNPPLPFGLKQGAQATNLFTIGLLPERIRERYGMQWNSTREAALSAIAIATRNSLKYVPGALRYWPHARRAFARAA